MTTLIQADPCGNHVHIKSAREFRLEYLIRQLLPANLVAQMEQHSEKLEDVIQEAAREAG